MKLPRISGKAAIEAFLRGGFTIHRIHGSHYILKHQSTGRRVTVPYHRKTLAPKTLNVIIMQSGMSHEDFLKLL